MAGWLVNEYFSRRAVRKNMWVDYLLSAYRRLEGVSNRRMSPNDDAALEQAVSDIQLLGSPKQVEMAAAFAREFADLQRADTELLLDDLRTSLRRELRLEPVPPRRMWLRIERDGADRLGPAVGESSWATWDHQSRVVEKSLRLAWRVESSEAEAGQGLIGASPFVQEMATLATTDPIGVVVACEQALVDELVRILRDHGVDDWRGISVAELARLAHERDLINEHTRDGVEGLRVMHTMAMLDDRGRRLTEQQAKEYLGLTEGLLLALRLVR